MKYIKSIVVLGVVLSLGFGLYNTVYTPINRHDITIYGIVDFKQVAHVQNVLTKTLPGDIVYWHINSPGGYVVAEEAILRAINRYNVTHVAILEGEASSCAWDNLMALDYVKIHRFGTIVIHASYLSNGFMIIHDDPWLVIDHQRQRDMYVNGGWLTNKEADKVLKSPWIDFYLTPKMFIDRTNLDSTHLQMLTKENELLINNPSIIIRLDRALLVYKKELSVINLKSFVLMMPIPQ